jgi:hypothetical protein
MATPDPQCGTDKCRAAHAAYMAAYRAKNPPSYRWEKRSKRAASRALWRLKNEYEDRYQELYHEEVTALEVTRG